MKKLLSKIARIETLYLLLALALPWKSLQQPPDSIIDYFPIRDAIRAHWFEPSLWLSPERLYRVPGYGVFLAVLSLISDSDTWFRLVQGLLLVHVLWMGKKVAARLGASPRVFAWAWTLSCVHFYFAQLALSETLATWLLMNAVYMTYLRKPAGVPGSLLEGLNACWMILVKPAFSALVPLVLWPWWRKKAGIAALLIIIVAWGMVLKPRAGKWVFLGAGGGLNLFIATLPGTFHYEGDALDRYWLEEQRKIGHPGVMGWYAYDDALKKDAMKRFPHWNFGPERLMSPFFGLQYKRGFQLKLLPFGTVLLAGAICAFFFQAPLISMIYLGSLAMHLILAPFARFVVPLAPLAALMIALMVTRVRGQTGRSHPREYFKPSDPA